MGSGGAEAISSMGNDTPLAVLSDQPQLLYNYSNNYLRRLLTTLDGILRNNY